MDTNVINHTGPQMHLYIEGSPRDIPRDIPLNELDVGVLSTDTQIRAAVAENTGIPVAKLRAYSIDKNEATGEMTMRPEAVFG